MKLRFCGAAKAVTGSCHMITFDGGSILVDCGMRQGEDAKGEYGEGDFPFVPGDIKAVLLTHAHIDHTGLVPLLVKRGFKGPIISTEATSQLCGIMLPDSAHIQEQDAEYQNRKNERAGKPLVEPLYTSQDAEAALKMFKPFRYGQILEVCPGVKARFTDVGHLLGSSAIEIWITEGGKTTRLVFSGDIGRDDRPIIKDPESPEAADYLIMESTYGDRNHEVTTDEEKEAEFARVLKNGIVRGGNIVIPAFAVGRTQELLYYIKRMLVNKTVPGLENVPVYVDSPLGIKATRIYAACGAECYDDETKALARSGDLFEFDTLKIAETADESKLINEAKGCNIIISASGMCDAGRIRHHLKNNLFKATTTVVFAGYQAVGTLGRMLVDGADKVKILGVPVIVNADIQKIQGFSGHAGQSELVDWVNGIGTKPAKIFLVHGENDAISALKGKLEQQGYDVEVPDMFQEFDLESGEVYSTETRLVKTAAAKPAARASNIKAELKRLMNALVEAVSEPSKVQDLADNVSDLASQLEQRLKQRQ